MIETPAVLFFLLASGIGLGVVVRAVRRAVFNSERRLAILGVGFITLALWASASYAMGFMTFVTAFGVAHLRQRSTGLFPGDWQIYGLLGLYAAFGIGLVIAIGRVPPERSEAHNKTLLVTSGILTADQVRAELEAAPDILRRYGIEQVVACFGIGSKANIDELWKPHEIHISELLEFAQTGIDRGLFCPAESDLFVTVPDNSTELKFCHESDIHLDSTNDALIGEFAQRWKAQGFSGFHKVGKRWVPFGAA